MCVVFGEKKPKVFLYSKKITKSVSLLTNTVGQRKWDQSRGRMTTAFNPSFGVKLASWAEVLRLGWCQVDISVLSQGRISGVNLLSFSLLGLHKSV